MEKLWFILVEGEEEGPYSVADLRFHPSFTPDTLTRKAGSKRWLAARYIRELNKAFEDKEDSEEEEEGSAKLPPSDEMAIDFSEEPPQFYLWLFAAAVLLVYILYRFFYEY